MNLVVLMNPWLPGRKTHTFKCTTQKNVHVCLLSAFNYMLTLSLLSTAQNQRGLNWTGTLLLVYFWNFCINTMTANHLAIWCELQPRSFVFPCFLWFSFTFFFLIACICLAQFSFLLRRRLYTSQNRHICTLWKTILLFCSVNWRHKKSKPKYRIWEQLW